MFRCAITGKITKSEEKQFKIITKTRPKTYFGTVKDEKGKIILQRDENGNFIKDDDGKPLPILVKVGEGFEIVEEISVSKAEYDKFMSQKNKAKEVIDTEIRKNIVG